MRVALIAPPFITVPPQQYGGTELFIAHLAEALKSRGEDVVVYTNGESTVHAEKRWIYEKAEWPLPTGGFGQLKDIDHNAWAVRDAMHHCDILHLNTAQGLVCSRFVEVPVVYTIHHPKERHLSEFYSRYPGVDYVCISESQCSLETMPRRHTILHGIDLAQYKFVEHKQQYLSFIGRIAPIKGTHLAIEVAKQSGIPLKIAGEIQPINRDYFQDKIKPHVDGKFIEYVGLADLAAKNELLGNSLAMLFPILWAEPFGLVMIEAMACGTPVLALGGGAVPEVVKEGVSGHIARTAKAMARHVTHLNLDPATVRKYAEDNFSLERMADEYMKLYRQILEERQSRPAA